MIIELWQKYRKQQRKLERKKVLFFIFDWHEWQGIFSSPEQQTQVLIHIRIKGEVGAVKPV